MPDRPIIPPPKIRYALLADYVDESASGKPFLCGVFDRYYVARQPDGKVLLTAGGVLVVQLEASLAHGTPLEVIMACESEDRHVIFTTGAMSVSFTATGPGMPWTARIQVQLGPMPFPDYGHYEWVIRVSGEEAGRLPFAVLAPPQ